MNKVHARGKRSKQPARKAAKVGTTAVDRRLLAQAERETAEGKAAKAPAEALREAKATLKEIHANAPPVPRRPTQRHPASDAAEAAGKVLREIGEIAVPMTLKEISDIIGVECRPSDFASTALDTLADQVDVLSQIAEKSETQGYETWTTIQNVVARMKLASRVTAWLEHESPLVSLPEVAP